MNRIRATGILIHENKLLMIHRFRDGEEYYVLPGGGVEDGETPREAVLREIKEETTIEVKLKNESVIFTDSYSINGEKSEHQLFLCEYVSGKPKLPNDSIEMSKTTENNSYKPLWIDIETISELNIKPPKTKVFLISYLKNYFMKKDYKTWHQRKSDIEQSNDTRVFFHEREIWWCSLGANVGFEQDGKGGKFARPVLVFKKFNKEIFWALPLSTRIKKSKFYAPVELNDGIKRVAIISQLRLIDGKRLIDKIGVIDEANYRDIQKAVINLCNL